MKGRTAIVLEFLKTIIIKKIDLPANTRKVTNDSAKEKERHILFVCVFLQSMRTAAVNLGSWNDELDSNRMADNRQMSSFVQRQKVMEQMDSETTIWCYTFNDRHVSEPSVSTALEFSFSLSCLCLFSKQLFNHHLWPSSPCPASPAPDKLNSRAASLSSFLFLLTRFSHFLFFLSFFSTLEGVKQQTSFSVRCFDGGEFQRSFNAGIIITTC